MNPLLLILAAVLLVAASLPLIARRARGLRRASLVVAINTLPANVGSSQRSRRYLASGALATRYVFVKAGADDQHIAAVAATSDQPLGVITDEAAAAEDPIDVELPITDRTLPLVAAEAIATLNVDLYMSAAGKVGLKPTAAGTYWRVARNKTLAGAANDPVECELLPPRKLIVIAALGNTNGEIAALSSSATTTQAEFNALRDKCEELSDDVRAIAAALDGSADVALATT